MARIEPAKAAPAADEEMEFYVKVTVPRGAAESWVRRVYEVDAADPDVLASVLAVNLSLAGLIKDCRFVGMVLKGGKS